MKAVKYKVKPTKKQRRAAKEFIKNDDTKVALLKAGYSKNVANKPKTVTERSGFIIALKEAGVTEEKLSKVLNDGLGATKIKELEGDFYVSDIPDHLVRHKYLETGLKVHKLIEDSKRTDVNITVTANSEQGEKLRKKFNQLIEGETLD